MSVTRRYISGRGRSRRRVAAGYASRRVGLPGLNCPPYGSGKRSTDSRNVP